MDFNNHERPDIFGYILDKSNQSVLVVSKRAEDLSADGGVEEFYDAIMLSDAPDNLKVGQLVKVWYADGVDESYPASGSVAKLEVVPVEKTEGAELTETEALRKALEVEELSEHVAVRAIEFDVVNSTWTIEWKRIPDGDGFSTEIADQ